MADSIAPDPPPAARCIPFLRPHMWTKWERQTLLFGMPGLVQERHCLRCGLTQLRSAT